MTARFLMCPPEYYEDAMTMCQRNITRCTVNGALAKAQWQILYKILTDQIGAEVDVVDPVRGLPNMVFTGYSGIVFNNNFIRSNYRAKERQPEGAFFEKWFQERGFQVVSIPRGFVFDGEGDMISFKGHLLYGYHSKSELHMPELVGDKMSLNSIALQLIDDRFHHLDAGLCVIGEDTLLCYRQAFTDLGQQILRGMAKNFFLIRRDEALTWACNSIIVDRRIIISEESKLSGDMLRLMGFKVYRVNISEFTKVCAGVKSLVLKI